MFLLSAATEETQRFLRCEFCKKFEPEFNTAGWCGFLVPDDSGRRLYACPQCFNREDKKCYEAMGEKLNEAIRPPQPQPLSIEELGP